MSFTRDHFFLATEATLPFVEKLTHTVEAAMDSLEDPAMFAWTLLEEDIREVVWVVFRDVDLRCAFCDYRLHLVSVAERRGDDGELVWSGGPAYMG